MRDSLIVLAAIAATFGIIEYFQVPHVVLEFSLRRQAWQISDLVIISLVAAIGLLYYAWRRHKELKREVDARCAAEAAVQQLARHDPLTGLPNRRFFNEKLDEVLKGIATSRRSVAVLILDLEGLKSVIDVHGRVVGDMALIEFAVRIGAVIGSATRSAIMARIGSDEFAVLLPDIASPDEPASLARWISSAVAKPFKVDGMETALDVGIGIAVAPANGTTARELVRCADLALHRSNGNGRSLTHFYEPAMDAHVNRRLTIERELRSAIATEQVTIHYQPVVDLIDNRIIGFEALARWHHPSFGDVPPNMFIAIAEETGLIYPLSNQLLRAACAEAKTWSDGLTLAFNISPLQLRDPGFAQRVLEILGETGLGPTRLELEITESAVVGDCILVRHLIDELREAGVRIALDDFGTGYATMSQLLSFRFDKIKIDHSFVRNLGRERDSDVIVRAIIGLAKGLGLVTTAEGIENSLQLTKLVADGCVEGQGFLFGKAVPAADLPGFINMQRKLGRVA